MEDIRLIAFDIDGTLVNSKKEFPQDLNYVFDALLSRGINIAIASGRQVFSLYRDFDKWKDQFYFIADNGAIVAHKGNYLEKKVLSSHQIQAVLDRVKGLPGVIPVVSGLDIAYIDESCTDDFMKFIQPYYRFAEVKNTENIDTDILKIACFVDHDSTSRIYEPCKDLSHLVDVCVSAHQWCDFNPLNSNKGIALTDLMNQLNLTKDQVMAFGDSSNDQAMLESVTHSVAMKNGLDSIKSVSKYITEHDNDHNGCMEFIKQFFNL